MSLIKAVLKIKSFKRVRPMSCVQYSFFDETLANSLANDLPVTWALYENDCLEIIELSQNINERSRNRSEKHEI